MMLPTNNTLRYVNMNKLHQALANNLCVALPGFHAFPGSTTLLHLTVKAKFDL